MAQLNKVKAKGKKRTTSDMISECTNMVNNAVCFLGLSAIPEKEDGDNGTDRNWAAHQFINIQKARNAPGGLVPVVAHFNFQRFSDAHTLGAR
jgi:hypothetical protein